MEEKETFKMTYSAEQHDEIERIRKKYIHKEQDKMERLRALDAGAEKKAFVPAILIGTFGTLLFGLGMSIVMSDFGNVFGKFSIYLGIVTGVLGIAALGCAYPLYNYILRKERERIAPEIIRLSNELMK